MLSGRDSLLTIRNLTLRRCWFIKPAAMTAITVKRTIIRRRHTQNSAARRSFRELARYYFLRERNLEFAIEALFFAIIAAISVWPVVAAATALSEFLQNTQV
jgi:hypothetical protein